MKNVSDLPRITGHTAASATHTCGDIKGFLIPVGKVSKLLKIVQLNTVVVSSYHHPHETYTEECWLASRLSRCFHRWIMYELHSPPNQHPAILSILIMEASELDTRTSA